MLLTEVRPGLGASDARARVVAGFQAIAMAAGVAIGCTSSTGPGGALYPPERVRFSCNMPGPVAVPRPYPFAFTFDAPERVTRGKPVTFTLTVRNTDSTIAYLWTALPSQSLNVLVRRGDDLTVWDRLIAEFDGVVELVAHSRTIRPGAAESFQVTWNQIGLNGRATPSGEYRVFATLGNSWYTGPDFREYVNDRSEPCSFRSESRVLIIEGL